LLDDVGFRASSAFGGPCQTPTAEPLAGEGLKYTRFHTTALCSPARAAMLSGRNHHTVRHRRDYRDGHVRAPLQLDAPEHLRRWPKSSSWTAIRRRSSASATRCPSSKPHRCPYQHWPTGSGFEHFYGFIGGENNQFYPELYVGTTPIEPERAPEEGYHLTEDLADKAIDYIRQQKALAPDKPFFVYFAPGATHAPHQVTKEWIAKYKGKFDQGWDKLREETFARQKGLGVIPPDCEFTRRPDEIPAWKKMDPKLWPVLAREMEIYAAFPEHADHHVGRITDSLADMKFLEDTLVYCIVGDNGASSEGSLIGAWNDEAAAEAPDLATPELLIERIDELGTARAQNHYAVGWALALDTPYQWTKQVASYFGGTRNGAIVN
jgi:arylsulfatase A-like enzyme